MRHHQVHIETSLNDAVASLILNPIPLSINAVRDYLMQSTVSKATSSFATCRIRVRANTEQGISDVIRRAIASKGNDITLWMMGIEKSGVPREID